MQENTPKIGDKYLVTTNNYFFAPDGQQYTAVFGTIKNIWPDHEILGIQTNRHSTNWYLQIGNMIVAGCQIYYAIKTDVCSKENYVREVTHELKISICDSGESRIYFADECKSQVTK